MGIHRPRRRNSLRYPGYDYAQPGAVYITICTHERQHIFGKVEDGVMAHSPAGLAVIARWEAIPGRFPTVGIDMVVVMPDHLHGIVFTGTDPDTEAGRATLGEVVRSFKASVYSDYGRGVKRHGWPRYDGALWQPNYYDHIVRTDAELATIRAYIEGNPGRW